MSKKATLETVVTLDSTKFQKGIKLVKSGSMVAAKALKVGLIATAAAGTAAVAALGAAAGFAGAKIAKGLNAVFEMGKGLNELSIASGFSAESVALWTRAMTDAGLGANSFSTAMSRMQKNVDDLGHGLQTQERIFGNIGLSMKDLKGLGPEKQFTTIADAIRGVSNEGTRAAAAVTIFGEEAGRGLMPIIMGSDRLGDAMTSLGDGARVLGENSEAFGRISELMKSLPKDKQTGFFAGVGSELTDTLLPILETLKDVDFTGKGVEFGKSLERGALMLLGTMPILKETMDRIIKFLSLAKFTPLGALVKGAYDKSTSSNTANFLESEGKRILQGATGTGFQEPDQPGFGSAVVNDALVRVAKALEENNAELKEQRQKTLSTE